MRKVHCAIMDRDDFGTRPGRESETGCCGADRTGRHQKVAEYSVETSRADKGREVGGNSEDPYGKGVAMLGAWPDD